MALKFILFEDIIDGSSMKSNKALMAELAKLAEYVFGESDFATEKAGNKADDVQIWCGDQLYKALANEYCKAFRFKSAFEIQAEGYAGPVMAWFFEPDGAFDDQIVVFTCESNGLFKNPRYVCGLLISEYDLERLLGDHGDDEDVEEEEEDEDDDEEEEDDDDEFKVVDGKCVIPEGATEIPDDAFSEDRTLQDAVIPASVEVIGDAAFSWCSGLKTVKINGPLRKICAEAFMGCRRLVSINIPDTVTRIGDEAFSGCESLEQLVIPDSVRTIGEDAFEDCDSLERIYIKDPDLLEDTGLDDNVEIITEFDEKDILPPAQRTHREYVFQYVLKATVGQAIKDLEEIVTNNPDGYIYFSDPAHNGGGEYITGIKEWKGLIILESSSDEDDALSAEDLLEELEDVNEDAGLVLGWGWELRNLDPEDGTVFLCDDDEIYFRYEDHDIRLFSAEDLSHLFSDFAEEYPDRSVVCKTKDGTFYPVEEVFDDDGMNYIVVKKGEKKISASDFKDGLDECYWSEGGVVVSFVPAKSYAAIFAKNTPVFFEDKVDGEDVIAFRLGETLCDTRIEDPYGDDGFVSDDDTLVTVDDLCDEEDAAPKKEAKSDEVVEAEPEPRIDPKSVSKAGESDKGDIILKLVSYSGSVIKMMTVLSGIDGIDEDAAFDILQKLPSVVREGISAKAAMKIGAILEDAGATIELARASDPVAKKEKPKPEAKKPEPKPKKTVAKKQTDKDKKPAETRAAKKTETNDKPLTGNSNGHDYVDLGLPSGVKWATCNIGASTPEEFGDYFAWGETQKKRSYSSDTYKVGGYHNHRINEILSSKDDAAHVQWGGEWRMPTKEEFIELSKYCEEEKTELNGVTGFRYKSKKNGKSIFLPGAGRRNERFDASNLRGFYWSSSRCEDDLINLGRAINGDSKAQDNTNYAWAFCTDYWAEKSMSWDDWCRYHGFSVRPVLG